VWGREDCEKGGLKRRPLGDIGEHHRPSFPTADSRERDGLLESGDYDKKSEQGLQGRKMGKRL